jgi:hypothetical protein
MTQTEAAEVVQDDHDQMPGGPGAPMPIAQLAVCWLGAAKSYD